MGGAFADSKTGLAQLREFGERTLASDAYRRLRDLLDYEENLSTLDMRVRLGIDGRVRGLEILAIKENQSNWFHASPMGRFLSKLSSLFRGYRFSEQELLARLIDGVFEGLEDELVQLFQLIGDLEFYLAGLAFRDLAESHGLGVCLPELIAPARMRAADAPARKLSALFNPLLLAQGVEVVPCDLVTSRHDMTVIVTGPNSGGKTRLLQSVAIAQMLGQSGFFVPAREATLGVAPGLFVSLIEEATADQIEGRLGMELIRIRSLFEKLRVGSVVVLDELCSGTNPSEGEEDLRAGHQFARRARAASLHHDPLPSVGGAYRSASSRTEARLFPGGARSASIFHLPLHPGGRANVAGAPHRGAPRGDSGGALGAHRGEQAHAPGA